MAAADAGAARARLERMPTTNHAVRLPGFAPREDYDTFPVRNEPKTTGPMMPMSNKNPQTQIPTHTLANFHAGCRAGDQSALSAWAEALERVGDISGANLLRQLPPARDEIASLVQYWCKAYPGDGIANFYRPAHLAPYWFCGDMEQEGDAGSRVVGALLGQWNTFYPAVEWLARDLSLLFVDIHTRLAVNNGHLSKTVFRLGAGEHFGPIEDGRVVSHISLREYDLDDAEAGGN